MIGIFLKPTASVPSTVQDDNVPLEGVPNTGVVSVGLVESTVFPLPVDDVTPVPPLATGSAVPEYVIANVPDVVIGLPAMLNTDGTVAATLVTEPVAAAFQVGIPAPADVST